VSGDGGWTRSETKVFKRVCAVSANRSVNVSFSVLGNTCYVTVILPVFLV
jgi:hypothetical protein